MRKSLLILLAVAALLLAAAPGVAAPAAGDETLLCAATGALEPAQVLPAEETEAEGEALLPTEALLPAEELVPKPVPAWCPYNEPCTFFCLDYQDCPPPECINGICVYGW